MIAAVFVAACGATVTTASPHTLTVPAADGAYSCVLNQLSAHGFSVVRSDSEARQVTAEREEGRVSSDMFPGNESAGIRQIEALVFDAEETMLRINARTFLRQTRGRDVGSEIPGGEDPELEGIAREIADACGG